jgi:hypothetical protein
MNIYDNKPVVIPTWELKLVVEMGTYQEEEWVPDQSIEPFDFEVYFDNVRLDLPPVLGTHLFNLPDTVDVVGHKLKLVVSRSHWEYLIRCRVFVEDIDIGYIIENTGSYYTVNGKSEYGTETMGVDGYQTIPIETPIYKWLLDNKKNVLSKLGVIK